MIHSLRLKDGQFSYLFVFLEDLISNVIKISSNDGELLWMVMVMVFNATFNNILVIAWQSVLFVEENGVPVENH